MCRFLRLSNWLVSTRGCIYRQEHFAPVYPKTLQVCMFQNNLKKKTSPFHLLAVYIYTSLCSQVPHLCIATLTLIDMNHLFPHKVLKHAHLEGARRIFSRKAGLSSASWILPLPRSNTLALDSSSECNTVTSADSDCKPRSTSGPEGRPDGERQRKQIKLNYSHFSL